MIPVAFIFPGQGSQCVGMGEDLYFMSRQGKAVFDKAEELVPGIREAMFRGPEEKLIETAFCQPAIFATSVAALHVLTAADSFKMLVKPVFTCGHSLGEYSALVACGALDFEAGLKLVQRRAQLMDEATKKTKGAMSAVIGAEESLIREVCAKTGAQIANYNSPDQIVITGEAQKVEEAGKQLSEAGAKRVIPLTVSGAFHSSLMAAAAEQFAGAVEQTAFASPVFPVLSNVDAQPTVDVSKIRQALPRQIVSSVLWTKSIEYIAAQGVSCFIELGAGTVLKGLLRKINRDLKVINIQKTDDVEKFSLG